MATTPGLPAPTHMPYYSSAHPSSHVVSLSLQGNPNPSVAQPYRRPRCRTMSCASPVFPSPRSLPRLQDSKTPCRRIPLSALLAPACLARVDAHAFRSQIEGARCTSAAEGQERQTRETQNSTVPRGSLKQTLACPGRILLPFSPPPPPPPVLALRGFYRRGANRDQVKHSCGRLGCTLHTRNPQNLILLQDDRLRVSCDCVQK